MQQFVWDEAFQWNNWITVKWNWPVSFAVNKIYIIVCINFHLSLTCAESSWTPPAAWHGPWRTCSLWEGAVRTHSDSRTCTSRRQTSWLDTWHLTAEMGQETDDVAVVWDKQQNLYNCFLNKWKLRAKNEPYHSPTGTGPPPHGHRGKRNTFKKRKTP